MHRRKKSITDSRILREVRLLNCKNVLFICAAGITTGLIVRSVQKSIDEKEYKRFLLYGVTGSRKNRSIFTVNTKNTRNAKNCNCFSP